MKLLNTITILILLYLVPIFLVLKGSKTSVVFKLIGVLLVAFFSWIGYLIFYFSQKVNQGAH